MATPPPLLGLRFRDGANILPQRYSGTSVGTMGTGFGSIATYYQSAVPRNRLVQFGGDVFVVGGTGIYKKDDPTAQTGTYTQVLAFTSPGTTDQQLRTGLHPVQLSNGTPGLMMAFSTTTNSEWRIVTFDGTTWAQSAPVAQAGANGVSQFGFREEVVYRNQIHATCLNNGVVVNHFVFDPSGTVSAPATPWGQAQNHDACMAVFDDRLFLVAYDQVSSYDLWEYTGTWANVSSNFAAVTRGQIDPGMSCLLVKDGFMYAIVGTAGGATTNGWRCYRFTTALAVTDQTDNVIPLARKETSKTGNGTGLNATAPTNERWVVVYDPDTVPGTVTVWLYFAAAATAGTAWTLYEWTAGAIALVANGSGGDVAHALPTGLQHGERIWTAGELDIKITGVTPVLGGEKVKFRCSGAAGAGDKTVTFRYSTDGGLATAQATLTDPFVVESGVPAGSASRSGNSVINIDADPTVEYSIIWDTTTDAPGDRAILVPFISV